MNEHGDDIDGDLMVRRALQHEYAAEGWVDADAALAGGRRRARRGRVRRGAVVGLAGAAAIGLAAIVLPGVGPNSRGTAAGTSFTPCSDQPAACHSSEVDAWVGESTGFSVSDPGAFVDHPGMPGDAVVYRPAVAGDEAVEIAVAVAPRGKADDLFVGLAAAPEVNGDTPDPDIVGYGRSPGDSPGYLAWGMDAAAGHGAVLLIYTGPVGSQPSEEEAGRLIRGLTGS